jgi:tetrapyrrole methylase family protein/MazG family protein
LVQPVFLAYADDYCESLLSARGVQFSIASDGDFECATLVIPRRPIDVLVDLVDRLLGPGGCPWDQEQTHETLTKHLIEESHELIDAIENKDLDAMKEELGDVLLQPFMHTQIQKRDGGVDADSVARQITEKLVRRHPQVFGDVVASDAAEVLKNWDKIKRTEKGESPKKSILSGIPRSLPGLHRAHEVSKRAARQGFEWENLDGVWEKLEEERQELIEAIRMGNPERVESELGDLLFTVVNIARWEKVDAESALRKMLDRFTARFQAMEELASKPLSELTAQEWDDLWNQAKQSYR